VSPGRRRIALLAATFALVAGLVVAAVVGSDDDAGQTGSLPTVSAADGPRLAGPCEAPITRAARAACGLPLEAKVAQVLLLGDAPAGELRRLGVGGVAIANASKAGLLAAPPPPRGGLAPWVLAAQEGGEHNALVGLPPVAAPADLPDARSAATEARASARALRGVGVNGVLGPVLDVGVEAGNALGTRVYSDDPEDVAAFAAQTVRAYGRGRVLSAVEHFPGVGAADALATDGPANVGLSLRELRQRDLLPFEAAIEAGVPAVVVGHGLYELTDFVTPASQSRAVMTKLLRDELEFRGVAITSDLAEPAVSLTTPVPKAAVQALRAGADLVYFSGPPSVQQATFEAVLKAVKGKKISQERLDEAVLRDVAAKRDYGLLR
jgi:beta-N-acetylhexosaminidase